MKSLQKVLLVVLLLVGINMLYAQPGGGPRGERQLQRLKEALNLTDKQAEQVKAILEKQREAMEKEREKNEGDWDAMRAAMLKQTEKSDNEIEKLLTKEQKKKFEEYKKERQERMKQFREQRN